MTASRPSSVLVAGVGNIFLADDGFGSEVAQRLLGTPMPEGVRVVDYGIGGIHLAYDLLDAVDRLILIDAVQRGAAPGTVSVMWVDPDDVGAAGLDSHAMDPAAVFANLRRLGGTMPPTLIVACEPEGCDEGMGLSDPVSAAVPVALRTVMELLDDPSGSTWPDMAES